MSTTLRDSFARLLAALPDAVVSACFLILWIAPFTFGPGGVRNGLLTMLVEFIVMHASGFLGSIMLDGHGPPAKRVAAIAGMGLFYAIFVAAFVLIFRETWPIWVFAWLMFGKFSGALARRGSDAQVERQKRQWGLSVAFYLAGVFLTTLLWIPRLGMSAALQPQFQLEGGGIWVNEPHRVIAFGFLYFAAMAWVKWKGIRNGQPSSPTRSLS